MVERRPGLLAEFDRQCCRLCWGLGLDKAAAARSLGVHRSRVRRALQRAVKALIERWTERHGASPDKAANEAMTPATDSHDRFSRSDSGLQCGAANADG